MNCKYYEVITETQAEPMQINDNGDYIAVPVEVPIGEVCHKTKTYDFNCEGCKLYALYNGNETRGL